MTAIMDLPKFFYDFDSASITQNTRQIMQNKLFSALMLSAIPLEKNFEYGLLYSHSYNI